MADDRDIAIRYLKAPHSAYWKWGDSGEVITWLDGRTIAFRAELAQVLSGLTPFGLPPLGAVLLLIAATRENWQRQEVIDGILQTAWKAVMNDDFYSAIDKLGTVRQLPTDLRSSAQSKVTLAQLVFEEAPYRTSPADAQVIVEALNRQLDEAILRTGLTDDRWLSDPNWLPGDVACLRAGLRHLTPHALVARRETGLDHLPQAGRELELPLSDRVRALLSDLKQDEEYAPMARLALDLMAAITVPRPVADIDEQQVGGVSDITNRGPLDRLLLSELANDDLTLAVRVAVNEALFLRRESPPKTPPRNRVILLDVGIRSWGIPRVYATAIGLALAATADKTTRVKTLRPQRNRLVDVDLSTRDGLVKHLSALEPALHPGPLLPRFQSILTKDEEGAEPVLVTTDDTFDDDEFQEALRTHLVPPYWVACMQRDGTLRLLERTAAGTKVIKEVHLDLNGLFPTAPQPKLIDDSVRQDLPAAILVKPFPLLLPHNVDPKKTWLIDGLGVLSIVSDNRLTYWTTRERGGAQVGQNVCRGALWWAANHADDGIARAVVGHMSPAGLRLLEIDLYHLSCTTKRLDVDRGVRGVCAHGGVLFAIFSQRVQVLAYETGETIQTVDLPAGMTWVRDRFFRRLPVQSEQWFALSFDGTTACFEAVTDPNFDERLLLTMLERPGIDGPIGITNSGDIYHTATKRFCKVLDLPDAVLSVFDVSRDGNKVTLHRQYPSSSDSTVVIDVKAESGEHYAFHPKTLILHQDYNEYVYPRNVRHRYTHIFVDSNGALCLIARQGERYTFGLSHDGIALNPQPDLPDQSRQIRFQNYTSKDDLGYRLSRVQWSDGSEAFLDTRGLLHLKSSDTSIPELCIVLTKGVLSGWCADGSFWGEPYYIGQHRAASETVIFAIIDRFARRIAR